jgi:hypothetical protein
LLSVGIAGLDCLFCAFVKPGKGVVGGTRSLPAAFAVGWVFLPVIVYRHPLAEP